MYVSSDSPLPRNSLSKLTPVPNRCHDTANRQAAEGRAQTYLTVPDISSFDSGELAGDAARILHQSQAARASILTGKIPEGSRDRFDWGDVANDAPEVVSLNGTPLQCAMGPRIPAVPPPPPVMKMPEPAPQAVTLPTPRRGRGAVVFVSAMPQTEGNDFSNLVSGGAQMQALPTRYMGLSGFAPPWGDASLVSPPLAGEVAGLSSWGKGLLAVGALVILGGAMYSDRRYKRRGR